MAHSVTSFSSHVPALFHALVLLLLHYDASISTIYIGLYYYVLDRAQKWILVRGRVPDYPKTRPEKLKPDPTRTQKF